MSQQPNTGQYAYPQPLYPQPPYPQYAPAPRTNGLAIASMVLGIVWLWGIGSILALIFGLVSMKQIKERGDGGKGMAIAGIVLGAIGVLSLIALFALVWAGTSATNEFDEIGRQLQSSGY